MTSFSDHRPAMESLSTISDLIGKRLTILRLNDVLCLDGVCPIRDGDQILYFDDDHLAKAGAENLSPCIEDALVYPFGSSQDSEYAFQTSGLQVCILRTARSQ